MAVIPAKAGIHFQGSVRAKWIPAFAEMTAKNVSAFRSENAIKKLPQVLKLVPLALTQPTRTFSPD
jgi:hypothetical protein